MYTNQMNEKNQPRKNIFFFWRETHCVQINWFEFIWNKSHKKNEVIVTNAVLEKEKSKFQSNRRNCSRSFWDEVTFAISQIYSKISEPDA